MAVKQQEKAANGSFSLPSQAAAERRRKNDLQKGPFL